MRMMNDSTRRFGGEVPPALDRNLQQASQELRNRPRAEALLIEAQVRDPDCLPVYFALYKFYFYSRRLKDAERIVLAALSAAARQAGISSRWQNLTRDSAAWHETSGPAHFYLFSLKALAFIRLRLGRRKQSAQLLMKIAELDPQDTIGASVVGSLASAVS